MCTTSSVQALCPSYTYDGDGRVHTMTDGRGKTTTYSYDKDDHVTQVLFDGATNCNVPAGTCLQYTYDDDGNLASRTDVSGTTTFSYDMLNQQSYESLPDGSSVASSYDAAGNLLTYTQSVHQGVGTITDTETYTHNAANRVTSLHNANTGGSLDSIGITPNKDGKPQTITYPTSGNIGSVATTYTASGHVKSITPSGTALPTYAYSWKSGSQETDEVQSVTTSHGPASQDGTINYTYNKSEELTAANDSSSQPDYSFSYDNAGNLQSQTIGAANTYFGYTEAGILCWQGTANGTHVAQACPSTPTGNTTVNHDAAGNNTGTAGSVNTYDAADRASGLAGVTQTYLDQGNDLRSADGTGSNAVNFVNGPLGVGARIADSNVTFYIRNTDGSLLEERGAPGTRYYVLGQHQSTTGLLNPDGTVAATYLYGPYGETSSTDTDSSGSAADNPWRWDGGYQEPASAGSFYHFGARYLDPGTARWTQPDPKSGSMTEPRSFEAYAVDEDDAINSADTSARSIGDFFADAAGVVAGGFTAYTALPIITVGLSGYAAGVAALDIAEITLGVVGVATGAFVVVAGLGIAVGVVYAVNQS